MQSDLRFFDAHTHVQFRAYDGDREAVLARAREAGVWMVNVGTQRDTSRASVELAEQGDGLFAAIGLHPIHTSRSHHDEDELGGGEAAKAFTSRGEIFDIAYYRALALNPKTVAIGECGLDYFHFNEDEPRDEQVRKQKAAFTAQIELSLEVGKPLMIHCRNAFIDLIEMLKDHKKSFDNLPGRGDGRLPGVIHFFTGTPDDARALLELGFAFTLGGVVTFPPRKGKTTGDYDEVVKLIPADRILSETDAPYVAPAPFRGKRNEPAYVVETVKRLAEIKERSPEAMKEQIWTNARSIFGI
jgi:TatD DNase family protein